MVKADVRRDYYADLGLTPSADAEDIKKQFRKLALKYHPDRNPGRELEFNAKFQAIQAAHEVLIDPQQRLKYDTDRLRHGYYGPTKSSPARKGPTASYHPAKPGAKAPFSERPKSFHHGPSTGAQRFASYARAAPKQPWEKTRDETQTRADAYRGFQEMKGTMPGWSSFDPRGRAGQPGAVPRPNATTNGQSARPKSAYEYVHASPNASTTESAHAQSARKKQGFAPRAAAGGDEPMAANTASYNNVPRYDRMYAPAPSPTARKPAAGAPGAADNPDTPELERSRNKYASTGGEKTFFSSAGLGRSSSTRASPKSPKLRPRTNPPSPTSQEDDRHRSASPSLNGDRSRDYSSTSSSGLSEDEVPFKPKAVPKSRLQRDQKFSSKSQFFNGWSSGTAAHDSDSAGSAKHASDTPMFSKKADFDFAHAFGSRNFPQNGAFRSSSHDDLRASSGRRDPFSFSQGTQGAGDRGRSARGGSYVPGNFGGDTPKHEFFNSDSASQQQTAFAAESFLNNNWEAAFKFKDLSEALPTNDSSQRQYHPVGSQRTRSPRKQSRPATRLRTAPQQPSVATEAEEAESTLEGRNGYSAPGAATPDADAEAMDLDDELPAKAPGPSSASEKPASSQGKTATSSSKTRPTPKSGGKDGKSSLLNLKILSGVFPFTTTNSSGLDDLKDVSSTLPFESRAKAPKTTMRDIHPRMLICPNPPKRPEPPQFVPISAGSTQLGITRIAMDRYVAEMNAYIQEWEAFDGRMITHFVARHTSNRTEMAPNWVGAVGDSVRLGNNGSQETDSGDESDDANTRATGAAKRGFSSYKNALMQDEKVLKHWEVARERHLECILKFGQMREWIRNGGKII